MHIWDKDGSALLKPSRVKLHIYTAESPGRSTSTMTPHHRQDVTRLYISFGVNVSPATPRRTHRIIFTNIACGHHRRQPSTSINSITSPPSPTVVIVNANKIFYFFN
jgi:hypothetical protein